MPSSRRTLAFATSALTLLALAPPASAAAFGRPVAPTSGSHTLAAAVVPGLADPSLVTDLGPLPSTDTFQVTVHIAEDQAGEAAELAAVTDPKSPQFGHYLTVEQYVAAFGEPVAVTAAVTRQLTAHGLHAVYTNRPGTLVVLQGSVAAVEATFQTPVDAFRTANGRVFRANTSVPTVPAAVDAVTGLETLSAPTTNQACPAGLNVGVCLGAITPQDLWSVYDQPATDEGAGQQIGIIGDGQADTVISDLRGFEADHGLRQVPVRVVSAADTFTYSAGEGEWALDSAATTGMAPQIDRLTYYFGDTLGSDAPFSAFADDGSPGHPMQANYSVGGCEALNYALGTVTTDEPLFRQMAIEGKTLFVSTGDTGGSCTVVTGNGFANTGAPQVEWPSSSDAVVGVGGTELATNGAEPNPTRALEKAWDYTGGGSSDLVQEPAWQSAIATIAQPCATVAVASPNGGSFCRGLPDVAALSGDITVVAGTAGQSTTTQGFEQGYTDHEGATETSEGGMVTPGSPTVDGGTSLASPLWVGMWTRVQAATGRVAGLGFAPPLLYGDAENPATDATDFYDISVGQNGQHQALPRTPTVDPTGWDYVSGLGVPDVAHLASTLAGSTTDPVAVSDTADGTVTRVDAAAITPATTCADGVVPATSTATAPTTVATSPQALTLVRTTFSEPTAGTIAVATQVQKLADGADTLEFTTSFDYLGAQYQVYAERDEPQGTTLFQLQSVTGQGATTGPTITTIATLTGTFDDASNTVTVDLPIATFDSAASPSVPLADGAQLTGLTTTDNTQADSIIAPDDTASTTCPYTVGGVAPAANLPEAPFAPLVLIGLVPVARVLWRRRKSRVAA